MRAVDVSQCNGCHTDLHAADGDCAMPADIARISQQRRCAPSLRPLGEMPRQIAAHLFRCDRRNRVVEFAHAAQPRNAVGDNEQQRERK